MTDNTINPIDKGMISEQKMQFRIINRRPKYSSKQRETIKGEIEKQLFAVFCKYACHN